MKNNVEEFLERYEERIDASLTKMGSRIAIELALKQLLKRWKDDLPMIDCRFCRNFRQMDVVDTENGPHMDMAFWHLLHGAELFWGVFNEMGLEKLNAYN